MEGNRVAANHLPVCSLNPPCPGECRPGPIHMQLMFGHSGRSFPEFYISNLAFQRLCQRIKLAIWWICFHGFANLPWRGSTYRRVSPAFCHVSIISAPCAVHQRSGVCQLGRDRFLDWRHVVGAYLILSTIGLDIVGRESRK